MKVLGLFFLLLDGVDRFKHPFLIKGKDLRDDDKKLKDHIQLSLILVLGFIFLLISVYVLWFSYHEEVLSTNSGDWGTFGDFIGGVANPLVALMAFFWLTVSVKLQAYEMKETRKAFQQSSNEQAKSAEAQAALVKQQEKATNAQIDAAKEQQKQIRVQAFENTFLSMLQQKSEVLDNISLTESMVSKELRNYFGNEKLIPPLIIYEGFLSEEDEVIKKRSNEKKNFLENMRGKQVVEIYLKIFIASIREEKNTSFPKYWDFFYYENCQEYFSSYFRICYQIVKFIDFNPDISGNILLKDKNVISGYKSNKKVYFDIFRSQLSSSEITLLFFNCLGSVGGKYFKKIAERYGLFEHLPFFEKEHFKNRCVSFAYLYEKSAFEDNHQWIRYFTEIERAGDDGVENRKKYGIDENQYQKWKNLTQSEKQDDEAK